MMLADATCVPSPLGKGFPRLLRGRQPRFDSARSLCRDNLILTMHWMRPQLVRVAGGWLVLHLCLLVSIPTTLCSTTPASIAAAGCTCNHGDGQMCPLHHSGSKAKSPSESHSCSCRSTTDPIAALASALIGPAAVLAPFASPVAPTRVAGWARPFKSETLESSSTPDAPPPRR
jgi:hypothetical protein